jgi:hypothetical protein
MIAMAFLLRVELPDVPGSLGALATALGSAGADIEAIQIVEHRNDGYAVDDVLLESPPSLMPDTLITACHALEGVKVHWISRYNAGVNLSMDLEAVESFTSEPEFAIARLIEVVPETFRVDWSMAVAPGEGGPTVTHATAAAPDLVPAARSWLGIESASVLPDIPDWGETVLAASPGKDPNGVPFVVAVGRRGGPAFLASEVARLGHMVSLAASVQR